jgi:hypothetical protein
VPALLGNVGWRLSVVVLHVGVGSRPEQESHALASVLNDAVVERGVALASLLVQGGAVLDEEVDDVQRVAILVVDGQVKTSFGKFLKDNEIIVQLPSFKSNLHT